MGALRWGAKAGVKVWLAGTLAAFACLGAAVASHGQASRSGVQAVRFGGDSHDTRVVVEMDRPAHGHEAGDGTPSRAAVLELAGVGADSDLEGHGQGLVSGWAFDKTLGGARLTLQLTRPAKIVRRFLLPPSDGVTVYRYVVDLEAADGQGPSQNQAQAQPPGQVQAQIETQVQAQAPIQLRGQTQAQAPSPAKLIKAAAITPLHLKKVIVIDAGHGGKDPGAHGESSVEKDVNLAAALALRAKLERTGRYRVVMTRADDTFVPLETRVDIARHAGADLFISLHSDSGADATVHGATVFTLSDKGSDRAARDVMGENDNWLIRVNLPGPDRAVNRILLDLTQRATRNRSAAFAEDLLGHIGDRIDETRHSRQDAGFVVLLAPDVPAVLLEMGFITNADDEARLNDAGQRNRFMGDVAASIDAYFNKQTEIASR